MTAAVNAAVTAAVPTAAVPTAAVTRLSDFNRDGHTDLILRETTAIHDGNGKLWLYPGRGDGTFLARRQMGYGFNSILMIVNAGDVTGDGVADVLATDRSRGRLWLYPGNGAGGVGAARQIGSGWSLMQVITNAADMTGDGRPDLLASDRDGKLWLYPLTGNAVFQPKRLIGPGWSVMSPIVAPGDVSGDGRADILARDQTQALWLYRGNGRGGMSGRTLVGYTWWGYRTLVAPGNFDGAGGNDLLAVDPSAGNGNLLLFPGDNAGHFGPSRLIGNGWDGRYLTIG